MGPGLPAGAKGRIRPCGPIPAEPQENHHLPGLRAGKLRHGFEPALSHRRQREQIKPPGGGGWWGSSCWILNLFKPSFVRLLGRGQDMESCTPLPAGRFAPRGAAWASMGTGASPSMAGHRGRRVALPRRRGNGGAEPSRDPQLLARVPAPALPTYPAILAARPEREGGGRRHRGPGS